MQALMLAAGMGRRLGKYTDNQAKCMVKVGGKTLLEHAVEALKLAGISRFIMVVGHEAERLMEFVRNNIKGMEIEFVLNKDYATTNNIYSLYLAREYLTKDDTILLESDLIFEPGIINDIVNMPDENVVAVSQYEHWMDGTVTILDRENRIIEFVEKKDFSYTNAGKYYKTVNIYKFSKEFSTNQYIPFLEAYICAYGVNQYYESVLKALAHLAYANLKAYIADKRLWYEIDDAQDLDIANTLFARWQDRLLAYERHFGGYWRFTKLKDFCYLVNPYFPPKKMLDQIKYFFDPLLTQYPSGMNTQKLLAGKMFNLDEELVLVGNGAAELINVLGRLLKGKIALPIPAFNEYIRCFRNCELVYIKSIEDDFCLNKDKLINAVVKCDAIAIINPDNPSGSFLMYDDLIEILDCCKKNNTTCIVDESFIDFAESKIRYTLLKENILNEYPGLIVVKSISKSYGVPGLRLGVMASSNLSLMRLARESLPIWNINSFAEYFLQIFTLYSDQYAAACDKIAEQRAMFQDKLRSIGYLKVYDSQANYIMCEVKDKYKSKELATRLLSEYNLLIKDLSEKTGFSGRQFIRIAVKNEEENECLYEALKKLEQER
jgi:histidinol-phosphate/aromatic aminotransferase/cobyric acid decarboxylase-like protein/choline kinase